MQRIHIHTTIVYAGSLLLLSGAAHAQHHELCDASQGVSPILSVGDFDGDGTVTHADVTLIANQLEDEYVPFFDLNADGALDGLDVSETANAMGEASTTLDQQLAQLYWGTERYRNVDNAILDGYRPFTQTLYGHGTHYTRLPILVTPEGGLDPDYENSQDGELVISEPEGLNYDENGNLVAAYYYHGIDVKALVLASLAGDNDTVAALFGQAIGISLHSAYSGGTWPELYDSPHALWHQHWGACIDDLDYAKMSLDPTHQPFFLDHEFLPNCLERVKPGSRQGYTTAFNMLHVWLYRLNPCGLFAGAHPHVSMGYPDDTAADPRTLEEWFEGMGSSQARSSWSAVNSVTGSPMVVESAT